MQAPAIILSEEDWKEIERELCERSLADFTRRAWHVIEPGEPLIWNWHLDVDCAYIEAFYRQIIKRLILTQPPGSMKSVAFSVMGPAWCWAKWPESRIINLTNESGLATRDSIRMRDIISSEWFQRLWPHIKLDSKQNEKTLYHNTEKGFRQGLGITGNLSGKRGRFIIIDDAIDTKKAFSDVENNRVNTGYDQAVSSRLNNMARDCIGIMCQRTRVDDLVGHVQGKKKQRWVTVRIPMEYEGEPGYDPVKDLGPEYAHLVDPRTKMGELMFPERFPRDVVEAWKEDLGEYGTASQLQQRPQPIGGGIFKKHYWSIWPKDQELPPYIQVFASYDTAFTDKDYKDAAYSARTTWAIIEVPTMTGVRHALILLEKWHKRVTYPDLKKEVLRHYADYGLDRVVVEKKASGISLHQDLRRMRGISVHGYDPKNNDKVARANMATPMMGAGLVYAPDRVWAEEMINMVATFPTGPQLSKDLADSISQAILYVRHKHWMQPPSDDDLPDIPYDESEEEAEDGRNERESAYG